jgi:hypothetical protein
MALTTREIPRERWRGCLDGLGRDLPDLLAGVEIIGGP